MEDADVAARYRAEKIEPATDISARELALLLEVLEADENADLRRGKGRRSGGTGDARGCLFGRIYRGFRIREKK